MAKEITVAIIECVSIFESGRGKSIEFRNVSGERLMGNLKIHLKSEDPDYNRFSIGSSYTLTLKPN